MRNLNFFPTLTYIQEVSGSIPLISTIKVLYLARFLTKTGFFKLL